MTEKKEKLWDYFILCARVLLAWTFFRYGWAKLSGGQFGIEAAELTKPLNEVGLLKLSWYLFDQQPYKVFIGVSQVIAGSLLLYNRTVLIGASLSIPILLNILMIDITYIKMPAFYYRLSYYLLLTFLILWHYRERIRIAVQALVKDVTTRFKYPFFGLISFYPSWPLVLKYSPLFHTYCIALSQTPQSLSKEFQRCLGDKRYD